MNEIEIKEKFLLEINKYSNAISLGDYKLANKVHNRLTLIYREAQKNNLLKIFCDLLSSNDENVKLWAATFSLKYSNKVAEDILQQLSTSTSITGLTAKTTLNLWKAGKLNLL